MTGTVPLRFGIVGAAHVARDFAKGLAGSPLAMIAAIASRDAAKAAAFAGELGIPRAYGSYEALLADSSIEAVYIPLPNDLHATWTIRALMAGKHVLCEKPLALSGAEARSMFATAKAHNVHLAEAYPYMAQPQTLALRALLAEGAIGRVQIVSVSFCFSLCSPDGTPLTDPANIRLDPMRGGGALLDAGSYAVSLARIAVGERPSRAQAAMRMTRGGVDLTVSATLEFPSGPIAHIDCSMATAYRRHAVIMGDRGIIETTYENQAPPGGGPLTLGIKHGVADTDPFTVMRTAATNGFRAEAEAFAGMVRGGVSAWTGATEAESVDTALALEAIAASGRSGGGWVAIDPV